MILFFISCDEKDVSGCSQQGACNYNSDATVDDGSCEFEQEYCSDSDGNGLGYGEPYLSCDGAPEGANGVWVNNCDDLTDDCDGTRDYCGECDGNNQSQDCNDDCFGNAEFDDCGVCDGENADKDCTLVCFGDNWELDDCGVCNNNVDMDCAGECFGTSIQDIYGDCCADSLIQPSGGRKFAGSDTIPDFLYSDHSLFSNYICLPETFKWSLTMTATLGSYENDIFIPHPDSISDNFTLGTHYLSTDGLDLLVDIVGNTEYNDAPQAPSTVENSIYFYTSHPEWGYWLGDDFTREYKFHDLEKLLGNFEDYSNYYFNDDSLIYEDGIYEYDHYAMEVEGISWDGTMTSDFYGEFYIKISFELESEEIDTGPNTTIFSFIELNFNDQDPISQIECYANEYENDIPDESIYRLGRGLFFTNSDSSGLDGENINLNACNIISENFEYIVPITFEGIGSLMPFNIEIKNTIIDPNISEEVR